MKATRNEPQLTLTVSGVIEMDPKENFLYRTSSVGRLRRIESIHYYARIHINDDAAPVIMYNYRGRNLIGDSEGNPGASFQSDHIIGRHVRDADSEAYRAYYEQVRLLASTHVGEAWADFTSQEVQA